jgi:hypothetical protein
LPMAFCISSAALASLSISILIPIPQPGQIMCPLRLQSRYGLFQFMSAARALKLDLTGVNARHSTDSLRAHESSE